MCMAIPCFSELCDKENSLMDSDIIYINKTEYEILPGVLYTGREIKELGNIDLSYQLWYLCNNEDDTLIFDNEELVLNGGESFQVVPIADRS